MKTNKTKHKKKLSNFTIFAGLLAGLSIISLMRKTPEGLYSGIFFICIAGLLEGISIFRKRKKANT